MIYAVYQLSSVVTVAVLYLRQPVRGLAAAAARPSAATFSREGRLLRILLTPGDGNCGK